MHVHAHTDVSAAWRDGTRERCTFDVYNTAEYHTQYTVLGICISTDLRCHSQLTQLASWKVSLTDHLSFSHRSSRARSRRGWRRCDGRRGLRPHRLHPHSHTAHGESRHTLSPQVSVLFFGLTFTFEMQ